MTNHPKKNHDFTDCWLVSWFFILYFHSSSMVEEFGHFSSFSPFFNVVSHLLPRFSHTFFLTPLYLREINSDKSEKSQLLTGQRCLKRDTFVLN